MMRLALTLTLLLLASPAYAAVSFIGAASANTTTVSLPGGAQAGDLAIVCAGRPNASGPSIPGGWTDQGVAGVTGGGTSHGSRLGWKLLQAADITAGNVGTWTNASQIGVAVYRGADGVQSVAASQATSDTVTLPARTGLTAWQFACATHRNSGTNTLKSRTASDYQNRSNALTSNNVGIWDSNGTTTGIAARTVTVSTSSGNAGWTMEIYTPVNTGATWKAALDTNITVNVDGGNVQLRLRASVLNEGNADGATAYKWRYSKNGGAYTDLTASSSNVKTFATTNYADGDDAVQLISSGTFLSDNNGAEESTGAFTLGSALAAATLMETETTLEVVAADVANGNTLDFRVYLADGTALETYTFTPRITIQKAGSPPAFTGKMQGGARVGPGWKIGP